MCIICRIILCISSSLFSLLIKHVHLLFHSFRPISWLQPFFFLGRRYLGHKRTIRPNSKRLSSLFMTRDQMDWDTFSKKVKSAQRGFMGEPDEMRPGRGEFHEYPYPCICEKEADDNDNDDTGSSNGVTSDGSEPAGMGVSAKV